MNTAGPEDARVDAARRVKAERGAWLRSFPNVNGLGVGLRRAGGELTGEICLRVYVSRKLPLDRLRPEEILPRRIGEVGVDVIENVVVEQAFVARVNPMIGGVSVGPSDVVGAGTLGIAVFDVRTGRDLLLSNWHVLSRDFDVVPGKGAVQPGRFDAPGAGNFVGRLVRAVLSRRVDAAVADVYGFRYLLPEIRDVGTPRRTAEARLGQRVHKHGRTTELTEGVVTDLDADFDVEYEGLGKRPFEGQLQIEGDGVSAKGDSGSVWVTEAGEVVGLLFAGVESGESANANPIDEVFGALDVSLTRGVRLHDLVEVTADLLH